MLWRMLQSEPDVLDAYQSTICRLTVRGHGAIKSNPSAYVYRTAMNAGIEILRSRQRQRRQRVALVELQRQRTGEQQSHSDASVLSLDQQEMIEHMRLCIYQLPAHLRDVIILRDLAELSYARLARILKIKVTTARLYRRHAIMRLTEAIGQEADL
jgi:RNA polymerase sigma factor (sigma-70 family)